MANMTFGVNILPKANADVSIGNSDNPWTIVSPELTGTPTAPTAASGTDNTQIATTAFVNNAIPGIATQSADGLMSSSDKTKLDGVATGATANVGTITGINMNGASKGTSGVVDLGTVITAHQDISGKLDTANVYNGLDKADAGFALDARQGKILNDSTVKLTGAQTIAGTKTFTSIPYFKNSTTSPSVIFQGTDLSNFNARIYASACEASGKYGQPYFNFYEYSPSSDGTTRTDYYESYQLPTVNAGRTSNGSYQILTTKENAIYDGLDSTSTSRPLSANQGKALNDHFGAYGYGTCATAAATTAKAATLSNYELHTGSIVAIRFTYAVPASATLNVNSKGAKAIRYRNAAIAANIIRAGDTATFVYDGTYYHLIAVDPGNMTWGQLCST